MTASPLAGHNASRSRLLTRTRNLSIAVVVALLALCLIYSWMTRGATAELALLRSQDQTGDKSLVSLRPWQTAQTLASTAATWQEAQFARQAEQLADHEVDQAFAAALRFADLQMHERVLTGPALALSRRVAQLQQEVTQDRLNVQRLQAKPAGPAHTASGAVSSATGSNAMLVANAQLGLDSDELTDTQRALDRAAGNLSVRIKDELAAHEASMRKYDSEQAIQAPIPVARVNHPGTLVGRIAVWLKQRDRYAALQQARAEALSNVQQLTSAYNQLQTEVGTASPGATATATLAGIQDRRTEQQILFIEQDRMQTDQQLAGVYDKWAGQVLLQHSILAHLLVQSVEVLLFILLAMMLGDALIRRLMDHPSLDRRQTQTLRTILQVGVQLAGILLIVLLLFGPPHQTATIVGLLTAALAISLQDYILAFLGWFMLAGKNGIRIGDMVEIDGVCGDVVDIGLLSTTLLETTGLAEKGEPTGRRVSFLNSFAIRGKYFNFSSEGRWLWDEITISVPASADIYAIATSVEEAARAETAETARLAEQEWNRTAPSTRLNRISAAPIVMMRPSMPLVDIATSIDIQVRYVTRAVGRYEVRDRLCKHVIRMLQEKNHLAAPESAAASGESVSRVLTA